MGSRVFLFWKVGSDARPNRHRLSAASSALPLLSVKELLPEGGQQFGFDEVGGDLEISNIQLPKYL